MSDFIEDVLEVMRVVKDLDKRLKRMEVTQLATRTELNTSIQVLTSALGSLATEQAAAFQRLRNLINSGQDFQAEFDQIVAINNQVQTLIANAQSQQ